MKVSNSNRTQIVQYVDINLEIILTHIYKCYERMIIDNDFIENNENKIKNRLYKDYLDNHKIRDAFGLNDFLFKTETALIDENYKEKGYFDIEVINLKASLKSTTAFHIIECKRIDGTYDLNYKYKKEGINRFIEEKYPTHYGANAMLGFVVNKIDIEQNSMKIKGLVKHHFMNDFEYSYKSNHTTKSQKDIILYHLMLDFSSKIEVSST